MENNNITTENTQVPEAVAETTPTVETEEVTSYDQLEEEALSFLNDTGESQEPAVENNQEVSNNENNQEPQGGEDLNLNDVDLSFLGIENKEENANNQKNPQAQGQVNTEEQQPNSELTELKQMIKNMNNNSTSTDNNNIPDEEAQAVTELFNKFKALGLIPENNGLGEEERQLLEDAKKMNESFRQQQEEQKAFEEHQSKLIALQDFDKELAETIPGYDSNLIQKAVADIHKQNPDAAMKIFNDPTLLIKLWKEIGGKSQPSQKQQNIITTNSTQANRISELEQKVNNGTATEHEEAEFLNAL